MKLEVISCKNSHLKAIYVLLFNRVKHLAITNIDIHRICLSRLDVVIASLAGLYCNKGSKHENSNLTTTSSLADRAYKLF